MAKLQNPCLPWIALLPLVLWRFITILLVLFSPPKQMYDFPLISRTCQYNRVKDILIPNNILTHTIWNKLSRVIDQCSYNPRIVTEKYRAENGLEIFHIPNRNQFLTQFSCSIVSVNNVMHSDGERKLAAASPCSFYASDKSIRERASYQTRVANLKVTMEPTKKRRELDEGNGSYITDLRSLITMNFGIHNVDNLIVGPFEHNIEFGTLLGQEYYRKFGSRLCQVNMIYERTNVGTFFIIKTSKSFDNRYMNVFSINFNEEYCVERYFKPKMDSYQKFEKREAFEPPTLKPNQKFINAE